MVNGNYAQWTDEENDRRSARLNRVLAHARQKINAIVRGRYLKMALGGIKTKNKAVAKRHMVVNGVETEDEIVQVTETEIELAPNLQALATWLYHHDPDWKKIERKQDTDDADIPADIDHGIPVDKWIKEQVTCND